MALRLRRPARVNVPSWALPDLGPLPVPDYLSELEKVPGRCHSRARVVSCQQEKPGSVCTDCALLELGESWADLKARTNAGLTVAQYERKLAAAAVNGTPRPRD